MYNRKLKKNYIQEKNGKRCDNTFVPGVINLQRNEELNLTIAEKSALATFKLDEVAKMTNTQMDLY